MDLVRHRIGPEMGFAKSSYMFGLSEAGWILVLIVQHQGASPSTVSPVLCLGSA